MKWHHHWNISEFFQKFRLCGSAKFLFLKKKKERKNKTKEAKKYVIFIYRLCNYSFFIQLIPENDFALNQETNLDSAKTEKFKLWLWKVWNNLCLKSSIHKVNPRTSTFLISFSYSLLRLPTKSDIVRGIIKF